MCHFIGAVEKAAVSQVLLSYRLPLQGGRTCWHLVRALVQHLLNTSTVNYLSQRWCRVEWSGVERNMDGEVGREEDWSGESEG